MVLIKNGEVHIGNGQVKYNCDILTDGQKITEIGENLNCPSNCKVIDATGKVVLPGFVDAVQNWGAYGPAWGDNDLGENSNPINPQMEAIYAFDQDSMNFQCVYEYGITSFGLFPSFGNVLGGKASAFKTYGHNPYDMLIKRDIAASCSVTNSPKYTYRGKQCPYTKMGIFWLLKQKFIDAKSYNGDEKENPELFNIKKILNKEMPLMVNCSTRAEINGALSLAEEFDLDIILLGAYGISDCHANNKYAKNILLGNRTDSGKEITYKLDIDAVRKLQQNGADIAICCSGESSSSGKECLLWNAILYLQMGFESEEVLQMITLNPAKILGIDEKVGSIEVGKDADIVVWSENPIKRFDAKPEHILMENIDLSEMEARKTCW